MGGTNLYRLFGCVAFIAQGFRASPEIRIAARSGRLSISVLKLQESKFKSSTTCYQDAWPPRANQGRGNLRCMRRSLSHIRTPPARVANCGSAEAGRHLVVPLPFYQPKLDGEH